jgi:8-oxo-dGTP pyrophosphatase MutT (NUDIX family)
MSKDPATPRPASTVVLLSESDDGPQVLLLRRPPTGFAADAWVFPGGTVDSDDYRLAPPAPGEPARWASRLDVADPAEAWGYVVAAFRETWEETGLLLGRAAAAEADVIAARRRVLGGVQKFSDAAAAVRLLPDTESLVYMSRWITPHSSPRRFDTRFFAAQVNQRAPITLEGGELLEARWVRPEAALDESGDGRYHLMTPTIYTLRRLTGFASVGATLSSLAAESPPSYLPRMRTGAQGIIIDVLPLEPE